jgi:hypothetical protein
MPRRSHFFQLSSSLLVWEPAPETTRAREYPRATAPPKETGTCGAFSISLPMTQPSQKGPFFELVCRRLLSRLRHNQTIGAHRTSAGHLIWIILHQGVSYEERGPIVHGPGDARQFIGDCDNHLVARCTLREPMHHLSMLTCWRLQFLRY